jgi:hypothetical protein
MKVKTIKFIQCGPCSINAPIVFEIFPFFEFFYNVIRHLDFVTFIHWKFDPGLCLLSKKIVQGLIKNVYTNQTFNMNVPLSYNNVFKWGGPLGIRSLTIFFGTPTMLWPKIICKINHEALNKWQTLWKWTYKNNAMLCCKHKCKLMFVR